jgi:hypothetical protein
MRQNCLEVHGIFSPLFMTLFVYMTPLKTASTLFELFLLDGAMFLVRLILRMVQLSKARILQLNEVDL